MAKTLKVFLYTLVYLVSISILIFIVYTLFKR